MMTGSLFKSYLFYLVILPCCMITYADSLTHYQKQSQKGYTLMSVPRSHVNDAIECARACSLSKPGCIGFNYKEDEKTCDLVDGLIPVSSPQQNFTEIWLSGNEYSFIELYPNMAIR